MNRPAFPAESTHHQTTHTMHTEHRPYDRSDLVSTWLEMRKYRNAHEDLRTYYVAAYSAFAKAFGIDLDVSPLKSPHPELDFFHRFFLQVAFAYGEVRTPFSNYLCATKEIVALYQKHKRALAKVESSTCKLYMKMLLEMVGLIWGGDAAMQVSWDELVACGHPEGNAPDPVDYW